MDYNDFTIVLPTLNEEGTIGTLIVELVRSCRGAQIIVADDGSVDGTEKIVADIARNNKGVTFVDRKSQGLRKGLTASAVHGILHAKTRFAIVMDADLQHPPGVAKKIADRLLDGNDIAVAIRTDVKDWQLYRKLISKTLIWIGYAVLVLRGSERCADIFSGFFGVDARLFAKTFGSNEGRFVDGGYKILFDFLKCNRRGSLRISEVGYSFGKRMHGASKAGFRQGLYLLESFLT